MCSNLKLSKSKNIVPGDVTHYQVYIPGVGRVHKVGIWGLNKGIVYNIVSETSMTKWQDHYSNRGFIEVVGFHEKRHDFHLKSSKPMNIAVLFNTRNEFAILTEKSEGAVALVHHRMPVILDDNVVSVDKWLVEGKILHIDPYRLISNKTA